jgi:hypothetical protein
MPRSTGKIRVCLLLLGLVFLAAQFHFCADLTAANNGGPHFCPFCATAGVAIATSIPTIGLAPAIVPMELMPAQVVISAEATFSISPRAPPSL